MHHLRTRGPSRTYGIRCTLRSQITLQKDEPVVASTDNKVSMAVANELPSAADLHYYWKDGSASKLLVRIKPGKTKTTLTTHGVRWRLICEEGEHTWAVDAANGGTQKIRLHSPDNTSCTNPQTTSTPASTAQTW